MTNHTKNAARNEIKLGKTGPEVFPLALGCMGMTAGIYGPVDEAEGERTIRAAIEAGVTLIDTGDFYSMGLNELLVGRAIKGQRDKVQLSVKYGALRGPDNSFAGVDTRPAATKNFLAYTLNRLGVDHIDIYRPARLDPAVPIEDTVGGLADLVKAGWIRHIGLSEVGAETIRRAHAVHPIVDVQLEYAVATRGPEASIFPVLKELGISATLYGVLSRGLLTGSKSKGAGDYRAHLPRFSGASGEKNAAVVQQFARFAKERDMTPAELAIAWVVAREPGFVPLLGSRTVPQLREALAALDHPLSAADVKALEGIVVVEGTRYHEEQMRSLDSEKK